MHFRSTVLVILFAAVLYAQASAMGKRKFRERSDSSAGRRSSPEMSRSNERSDNSKSDRSGKSVSMSVEVHANKKHRSGSRSDSSKGSRSHSRSVSRSVSISIEKTIHHNRFVPYRYYLEQSPINIKSKSKSVGFDRLLKPLNFNYKSANSYTLKNIGRDFIVKFSDDFDSFVSGGPLEQPYYLSYLQIRWGKKNWRGSEHLVNGRGYGAEVQLVHFNKGKYGTFDEAAKHGDGLAVVSIFLKLAHRTNHPMHLLSKFLHKIPKKHMKVNLRTTLPLAELLPKNVQKFWTYSGSLTRRPFTENAVWIVLRNPTLFSKKELFMLRRFRPTNRRRLQPLNDRVIRASFHKLGQLGKW